MKRWSGVQLLFWIFLFAFGHSECVNVHFENKDGGFFLKQSPRQHFQPTPETAATSGSLLAVDRFTVFQSSQPISVRATYGPFSTKQTVPARYVVPDPLPLNTSGPSIDLQELATHHLDMSAHMVRSEISRDSPVLRVLFHTGSDPGGRRQILLARHHQKVCIILQASLPDKTPLHTACSPDGEDGVCLAQITIPSTWWPPLPTPSKDGRLGKPSKSPARLVQVAYTVLEPRPDESEGCQPRVQIQPSTILGKVPLVPAKSAYKEVKIGDSLMMLVPHPPLFPLSRLHIHVFVDKQKAKKAAAIIIRGRVKSGLRLLDASPVESLTTWNMSVEINPRHTGASVTLMRKEQPDTVIEDATDGEVLELFTWLAEIAEDAAEYDGARIVWSVKFEPHQEETEGRKNFTKLDVEKDDIQAVVPISKNWEVLNTAVLTGKQVSQAMKVFIVSQAGKAADVTFQASCHSEDDSVLKVSSSCSSVYVDGSEARGSVNGSVLVKYGTYTGLARFTVWMPEFPLDLQVSDTRLSQLKMWKVPDYSTSGGKGRRKRAYGSGWGGTSSIPDDFGNVIEKTTCRLRYQQTPVDVHAQFMASDHDTGRVTYLINRRTWLRVTDLVLPFLRVSDPHIATLNGRILQGRMSGRTEVQVLSPITGRVIGAKEVRVGNDKVWLTKLMVQVVSGLQLNISPDSSTENGYIAETSVTRKLTAQYQEGLLDIEIEFSDGTHTPLREISDKDYHLVVESSDPEIVAFAPMMASHHPRVIAVGEGSGDLLHVTLLLSEECRISARTKTKSNGVLASADAAVEVDFSSSDLPHRPDILQNDGGSYGNSKGRDFPDLQDILKDDKRDSDMQARTYPGGKGVTKHHAPMHMTPLEISMYVLLTAFCFAIVVFVVSCVVYASRFKPAEPGVGLRTAPVVNPTSLVINREHRKPRETITNAHDWVWLGRATLEYGSKRSSAVLNNNATEMRITANPLNANYCEPEDSLATSFSNPTHIELPSRPPEASSSVNHPVDSATYSKSKSTVAIPENDPNEINTDEVQIWNKPTPPPPLPPHGIQQKPEPSNDEYRPPVPPHRNVTSNNTPPEAVQVRKHHHHHHHRNSKQQTPERDSNRHSQRYVKPLMDFAGATQDEGECKASVSPQPGMRSVFEFDDEPQEAAKNVGVGVKMRSKSCKKDDGDEDDLYFVQFPKSPNSNKNGRNSAEVKRATIVGNPMFSADENMRKSGLTPSDLAGLDDLQLDMDYDQIMHYFENLKESNA